MAAHMDLCLQPSASETFNLTTADAIAEGVPCVVSTAIDWAPSDWHVDTDDAEQIARVGWQLLTNPHAGREGLDALKHYQHNAVAQWKRLLKVDES
jgi:glycosyltransferase involved in cell wall biosynthesis